MEHATPLITILVAGLGFAFVFGALAHRLRISPIVGYLLAGVAVGPFTPGFVGNPALAAELAEIGVILLMFGVGLHFSLKDLVSVQRIAVPGALAQIALATLLGVGLAALLGWDLAAGLIFGLALSVASTVVLLRALQERRLLDSRRGRIAVGWLVVEDLAMVVALVLIPALATSWGRDGAGAPTGSDLGWALLATLAKVMGFIAIMLLVGRRIIPWILHWVAHTGSRELFRLAVLAIALGVAYAAATLFDVSLALGAFFAGLVLSESDLSQRAAEESLPLRDAFAVLFFVSVGMLFDPGIIVRAPLQLAATLAIILFGKSLAAFLIARAFALSARTALTISASLAQIGEFSFVLAGLGVSLGLLPEMGRDLMLAGAILSILINPAMFSLAKYLTPAPAAQAEAVQVPIRPTSLSGHSVLVGYGRVGSLVGHGLKQAGEPLLVIEDRRVPLDAAQADGAEVLSGNAADPRILGAANLPGARRLLVAIPQAFEAAQVVEQARSANPALYIVARAHSDAELDNLRRRGADHVIMGEQEIATAMLKRIDPAWRTEKL